MREGEEFYFLFQTWGLSSSSAMTPATSVTTSWQTWLSSSSSLIGRLVGPGELFSAQKLNKLKLSSSWKTEVFKPDVISGASLDLRELSTRLSLPKFELKYSKDLTPLLNELGLDLAGDFSGLTDSSVAVSDVLTKTFLRVDEEGSEGAAATAVIMGR